MHKFLLPLTLLLVLSPMLVNAQSSVDLDRTFISVAKQEASRHRNPSTRRSLIRMLSSRTRQTAEIQAAKTVCTRIGQGKTDDEILDEDLNVISKTYPRRPNTQKLESTLALIRLAIAVPIYCPEFNPTIKPSLRF